MAWICCGSGLVSRCLSQWIWPGSGANLAWIWHGSGANLTWTWCGYGMDLDLATFPGVWAPVFLGPSVRAWSDEPFIIVSTYISHLPPLTAHSQHISAFLTCMGARLCLCLWCVCVCVCVYACGLCVPVPVVYACLCLWCMCACACGVCVPVPVPVAYVGTGGHSSGGGQHVPAA